MNTKTINYCQFVGVVNSINECISATGAYGVKFVLGVDYQYYHAQKGCYICVPNNQEITVYGAYRQLLKTQLNPGDSVYAVAELVNSSVLDNFQRSDTSHALLCKELMRFNQMQDAYTKIF